VPVCTARRLVSFVRTRPPKFDHEGDLEGTPVSLGCSDDDPHFPVERVHQSRDVFERLTFKTLYMQYELAHLSKVLLYVGFPTLLGGGIFLMTLASGSPPLQGWV
jgi:hypothetical protein